MGTTEAFASLPAHFTLDIRKFLTAIETLPNDAVTQPEYIERHDMTRHDIAWQSYHRAEAGEM